MPKAVENDLSPNLFSDTCYACPKCSGCIEILAVSATLVVANDASAMVTEEGFDWADDAPAKCHRADCDWRGLASEAVMQED